MTPKIQHSLHALAMAARKSMTPDELAAHTEAITSEVSAMLSKSGKRGAFEEIFGQAGMEGDFATVKNVSAATSLGPIEIRGNPRAMTERLATKMGETAIMHLKFSLVMRLGEFPELAALYRIIADTEHEWAMKIAGLAEKIPPVK